MEQRKKTAPSTLAMPNKIKSTETKAQDDMEPLDVGIVRYSLECSLGHTFARSL